MDNKLKIEVDGTPLTLEVTTRYRKPASQVNLDKVRHRFEEYEMLVKDKEQMAMTIEALDQNVLGLEEKLRELRDANDEFHKDFDRFNSQIRRLKEIDSIHKEQIKDLNRLNDEFMNESIDADKKLQKAKRSENFWFGATIVFIIVSVVLALSL